MAYKAPHTDVRFSPIIGVHIWWLVRGYSAYHEQQRILLIWNLEDGCDIYRLTDHHPYSLIHLHRLSCRVRQNHICQVQFDLNGRVAITGSDNGEVMLWDVALGKLVQVLHHGKGSSKCLYWLSDSSVQQNDKLFKLSLWVGSVNLLLGKLMCVNSITLLGTPSISLLVVHPIQVMYDHASKYGPTRLVWCAMLCEHLDWLTVC